MYYYAKDRQSIGFKQNDFHSKDMRNSSNNKEVHINKHSKYIKCLNNDIWNHQDMTSGTLPS